MSELARKNGWRGFDGLGERVKGGYEYRCDGMPGPMGCGESVTVSRAWTTVGIKKSSWCVCYGENEDGSFDVDVVLTFCPPCAQYVATPVSTHPTESDDDSIPDDASRLVAKVKAARENASTQPMVSEDDRG